MRAVLGANTFAIDKGGAAVGISAGYLLAVLPAMAALLPSVGYAPHCNTLAICSVFTAHASRLRFGGAAVHRAWLPVVCTAKASCTNSVGAPINRANLCILPLLPPFLSFLASTFCSTRALLLTTNSQHWRQHRIPRPLCQCCRLRALPRCTASAPQHFYPVANRVVHCAVLYLERWRGGGGGRW
jgi:hypothetical protein